MSAVAVTVPTKVRYINAEWRHKSESPRIGSKESRRANTAYQNVEVHNARPRIAFGEIGLDQTGFALSTNKTTCTDFRDSDVIKRDYLPEMRDLVCRLTGASAAYHYSHLVRTEKPVNFNDGYARFVHCDYNVRRIEEMSLGVLKDHGIAVKEGQKFAWFNTWQPFDNPAINNPLAFIDANTLPREDVIDYFYTGNNRDSLVAAPIYSPDHRWCYFPEMTTEEVIVLKQMDQRPGRVVYCPHTSFDNPLVGDDAPPRRSIETRIVAVFDPE
ncbi:MAG: CmcJ/NvfI family oxidoreductase [Alphaproteobacteria bacterium]|nr:CmcJ/NvfI family oxidoreductase [Alphaproteobacteria bacterium]